MNCELRDLLLIANVLHFGRPGHQQNMQSPSSMQTKIFEKHKANFQLTLLINHSLTINSQASHHHADFFVCIAANICLSFSQIVVICIFHWIFNDAIVSRQHIFLHNFLSFWFVRGRAVRMKESIVPTVRGSSPDLKVTWTKNYDLSLEIHDLKDTWLELRDLIWLHFYPWLKIATLTIKSCTKGCNRDVSVNLRLCMHRIVEHF